MPGYKERLAFGLDVGKTAAVIGHMKGCGGGEEFSD
jgi:hypothetical protein